MPDQLISRQKAHELRVALENAFSNYNDDPDTFHELLNRVVQDIYTLLAHHNIRRLAIPAEIGVTNPQLEFSNNLVVENKELFSFEELRERNFYDSAIVFTDVFNDKAGYVLEKVLEALDFYTQNSIPVSDWDGETETTRILRACDATVEGELIPEYHENILGSDCRVNSVVEIWPDKGLRLITFLGFEGIEHPYAQDFQINDFHPGQTPVGFFYNARLMLECGVLGTATLMKHFHIAPSDATSMMNALAVALKNEAKAKGYRSAKDFVPLFESLGIFYRFRPQNLYDDPDFFGPDDEI